MQGMIEYYTMTVSIRIGAEGIPAEKHSPVGEPLTRVMPAEYAVEIV